MDLLTEVPSSLKQLARLVVRGFYSIEDSLIVDMLVRNPCMKEDDLCDLLKFERKMLRARVQTLKNDKFLQIKLKMETTADGKMQKINYYFIQYKTFVNVVKYKLDLMRKKMETEERDATNRASFKCLSCLKTFTDLEVDELMDFQTGFLRCSFCGAEVEEDESALPKRDSRLLLARFNNQMEPLFELLRQVEDVRLAPEILEPEPTDLSKIIGSSFSNQLKPGTGQQWSGEATRKQNLMDTQTVEISIGDQEETKETKKARPVWMTESTVLEPVIGQIGSTPKSKQDASDGKPSSDDIMSVLLLHEKKPTSASAALSLPDVGHDSLKLERVDSSEEENAVERIEFGQGSHLRHHDVDGSTALMDSDDDDDNVVVSYGVDNRTIPLSEVNGAIIAQMNEQQKQVYIQLYQQQYSSAFDY